MSDTHLPTPTRFIQVGGDRFAYRHCGNTQSAQPPLFFVPHLRGGLDHWDPLLAEGREVILFNCRRGVASSTGTPGNRIEGLAGDIALVIQALGRQVAPNPVPTAEDLLYLFFGRSEARSKRGRPSGSIATRVPTKPWHAAFRTRNWPSTRTRGMAGSSRTMRSSCQTRGPF